MATARDTHGETSRSAAHLMQRHSIASALHSGGFATQRLTSEVGMSRFFRTFTFLTMAAGISLFAALPAMSQPFIRRGFGVVGAAAGKGMVALPYRAPQADAFGN